LFEVNNLVDSKNDKIKGPLKDEVGALTDDERLRNREKLAQAARDARAIEQVIDKATRATKDVGKKLAPTNFDTSPG
jgi:uncharacterized protein YjbJ (UPF0337 family)